MDKYSYAYIDDKGIYCYKDSDVLINKLSIRDESAFYKTERLYTSIRQSEIKNDPIKGKFDFAHLNALHPFREGNGRTQREFIRYLAGINGYGLDWSKVTPNQNIVASYESVNGNNEKMHKIIKNIIYELNDEEKKIFSVLL